LKGNKWNKRNRSEYKEAIRRENARQGKERDKDRVKEFYSLLNNRECKAGSSTQSSVKCA
jgi:hypothetical protein